LHFEILVAKTGVVYSETGWGTEEGKVVGPFRPRKKKPASFTFD